MHKLRLFFWGFMVSLYAHSQFVISTDFEKSKGTETNTYEEVISFYQQASEASSQLNLLPFGKTDSGEPLHLLRVQAKEPLKNPLKILVINGIHPGEPDGIDACMLWIKNILNNQWSLPSNVELYIVPVYNIGGAKNRNSTTRVNQQGPVEHGFRGNALNYDLNRDFIKSDTYNSKAFYEIFQYVQPAVFIDTHVSNGADYQYTLTHLFTQPQQLGGELGVYLKEKYIPTIEAELTAQQWPTTPYVNVFNRSPEKGFAQFLDTPRYSTGFTRLWNTVGIMIETHMLKPYPQRVEGTLAMLKTIATVSAKEAEMIKNLQAQLLQKHLQATKYHFNFKLDTAKYSTFNFLGYESRMEKSKVTTGERLFYDRTKPIETQINYYDQYVPSKEVNIPDYYIIPKAYQKILELLSLNQVEMTLIEKDTLLNAEVYYIKSYQTRKAPYEGHYVHTQTEVERRKEMVNIAKGDVRIDTRQKAIRYILETLEPEAVDSFFNWNFFDPILQQKEGFSPYVFEEMAEEILHSQPELANTFQEKIAMDEDFKKDSNAQLDWIYHRSPYYEKAHQRYPILRILR